jgi:hypothetical protein
VSRAYDAVDQFVDPAVRTDMVHTRTIGDDILRLRANYDKDDIPRAIEEVLGAITRPDGVNYQGIKNLRTEIGELQTRTPEGVSRKYLDAIYRGLSDDLRASVQASGGPRGLAAWERANAEHQASKDWQEIVAKVLGTETTSNEDIISKLQRFASAGKGSDIRTLRHARAAIPEPQWREVTASIVNGLGRNRKGEFSPAQFLNDYNGLSPMGRRLLFEGVGSGEVVPFLDDIARSSQFFLRAGKLANPSGTAGHATTVGLMAGLGEALMSGEPKHALYVLGGLVGNNMLARLLSKPSTAASTARWARVYNNYVSQPSPRSLGALNVATRNLVNTGGIDLGGLAGEKMPDVEETNAKQPEAP